MASKANDSALPVDTRGVRCRCDGVEARVDLHGRPVMDQASGEQKHAVYLMVRRDGRARPDQWTVTVAGPPKIAVDQYVDVNGLIAYPWEHEGKHGIALRAESIVPSSRPVESAPKAS